MKKSDLLIERIKIQLFTGEKWETRFLKFHTGFLREDVKEYLKENNCKKLIATHSSGATIIIFND